jgi:hypothetical protein
MKKNLLLLDAHLAASSNKESKNREIGILIGSQF